MSISDTIEDLSNMSDMYDLVEEELLKEESANQPVQTKLTTQISPEDNVVLTVAVDRDSGIIYTMQRDLQELNPNSEIPPFELKTFLKGVDEVAITTYMAYLRGEAVDIIDRHTIIGCLRIYSLTGDQNFFKHILFQLFNFWTLLSPVLYDPRVANEIKYNVWLFCPRQLLPQWYLDDNIFMRSWLANPDNKLVQLNKGEKLIYLEEKLEGSADELEQKKTLYEREIDNVIITVNDSRNSHLNDNETTVGHKLVYQTLFRGGYESSLQHGLQVKEDYLKNKKFATIYLDGLISGPSRLYSHGQLVDDEYYLDDKPIADRAYYKSGRVRFISYSKDHVTHEEEYHDDEHNSLRLVSDIERWPDGRFKAMFFTAYMPDGSYVEIDDVIISFYSKDNKLTEQLIRSNIYDENRRIIYDDNENVVSETFVTNQYEQGVRDRLILSVD